MSRWDIALTRELIGKKHGSTQIDLMRNCLRSVSERQLHARYHFQEARSLMAGQIDTRLPKESIYKITWPTTAEDRMAFQNCFMKVEAHVIACAQAIHAIADNLAHVAYFALGVNLGPHSMQERDVTLRTVVSVVKAHYVNAAEVAAILGVLRDDQAFQIVDAFVNIAKHRGFAETQINIEPPNSQAPYRLEFGSFSYRDTSHPERDIEEVLAPSYASVSQAVVQCGNAVNTVLLA